MITPLSIKSAQNKAKKTQTDVFLSDDTGQRLGWRLLLRCLPSGSATWIFRYTHAGKRYQINFGNLQSLDTPSARRTANDYADIYKDTTDVLGKLQALLDAGKGRTANKLRSFVRAAYALVLRAESDATSPAAALDFATIGGVESNPAALLAVAKGFNGTRDRVLTDIELFTLLDHAKDYPGLAGLAVRATVFLGGQWMAQLLRAVMVLRNQRRLLERQLRVARVGQKWKICASNWKKPVRKLLN